MSYTSINKKHSFEDVKAWSEARKFRKRIYDLVKNFPKDEIYGLVSQMKRSSVSIHSNIAEGYGRFNFQENIQFCRIARGSLNEVLDQLYVALDERYVNKDEFSNIYSNGRELEININGYIKFLKEQLEKYKK